ncbi:glycosyltransferase family 4 protein [Actinobacillus pleuropneumoniae]|uniref:glycosyltransferase family 4 protein n=1 Tax=Actinobacillus pleuropneumoniae TaxID=715 RepID=UPI003F7B99E1
MEITYLPNPITIDYKYDIKTYPKKNKIIFLGRIESVKRGWLFCEIAKKCPEYEFYMLGQSFFDAERNSEIMEKYNNIPNLYFSGHVDGKEKEEYLKDAKILINTSIHEALPISFLEALSYGTLLVSNQNPENVTEKFGIYVGQVLGNGFDKVDLYVDAVKSLIEDDNRRQMLAEKAIEYVKEVHNYERFDRDIMKILEHVCCHS